MTALVRSPEKAADLEGAKLVAGDARNESDLRKALEGQDTVISALGTPPSCQAAIGPYPCPAALRPISPV